MRMRAIMLVLAWSIAAAALARGPEVAGIRAYDLPGYTIVTLDPTAAQAAARASVKADAILGRLLGGANTARNAPTILALFPNAIWARYLQDKVKPEIADQYRSAVFAAQISINSKDDMLAFTRRFFQQHGVQMPFVPDPTGQLAREVKADRALGERMGLQHTPTIVVCSAKQWVQVTDPTQLYQTIEAVMAQAGPAAPEKTTASVAKKPSSRKRP